MCHIYYASPCSKKYVVRVSNNILLSSYSIHTSLFVFFWFLSLQKLKEIIIILKMNVLLFPCLSKYSICFETMLHFCAIWIKTILPSKFDVTKQAKIFFLNNCGPNRCLYKTLATMMTWWQTIRFKMSQINLPNPFTTFLKRPTTTFQTRRESTCVVKRDWDTHNKSYREGW